MKLMKYFVLCILSFLGCKSQNGEDENLSKHDSIAHYQEPHRLQLHFSPETNWMNDPNGLVYLNDTYHLFYQYYPDSTVWGPMHWGHATSQDLVHWKNQPIALFPDSLGYIFSGSAVFDKKNTSGLGTDAHPPIVAVFTYHDPVGEEKATNSFQTQGIAYSLDNGKSWKKYEHNPVLENPGSPDFRDPKVFWMDEIDQWVMSLAVKDHISFYASADLKKWNKLSEFGENMGAHGGVWECPDLISFGDHWVLLVSINPGGPNEGSATQYFIGGFDGKSFTPYDSITRWVDYGRDNYAGVTWSNIPPSANRTLFIGWMSNWDYAQVVPTAPWRSAMTIPRTLKLDSTSRGFLLKSYPVEEVKALRKEKVTLEETEAKLAVLNPANFSAYDLNLNIKSKSEINSFTLQIYNAAGDTLDLGYNADEKVFYINRDRVGQNDFSNKFTGVQKANYSLDEPTATLRLIVDIGSIELFVNEGELVMTSLFFPNEKLTGAQFINESNEESMKVSGVIHDLESIWQ